MRRWPIVACFVAVQALRHGVPSQTEVTFTQPQVDIMGKVTALLADMANKVTAEAARERSDFENDTQEINATLATQNADLQALQDRIVDINTDLAAAVAVQNTAKQTMDSLATTSLKLQTEIDTENRHSEQDKATFQQHESDLIGSSAQLQAAVAVVQSKDSGNGNSLMQSGSYVMVKQGLIQLQKALSNGAGKVLDLQSQQHLQRVMHEAELLANRFSPKQDAFLQFENQKQTAPNGGAQDSADSFSGIAGTLKDILLQTQSELQDLRDKEQIKRTAHNQLVASLKDQVRENQADLTALNVQVSSTQATMSSKKQDLLSSLAIAQVANASRQATLADRAQKQKVHEAHVNKTQETLLAISKASEILQNYIRKVNSTKQNPTLQNRTSAEDALFDNLNSDISMNTAANVTNRSGVLFQSSDEFSLARADGSWAPKGFLPDGVVVRSVDPSAEDSLADSEIKASRDEMVALERQLNPSLALAEAAAKAETQKQEAVAAAAATAKQEEDKKAREELAIMLAKPEARAEIDRKAANDDMERLEASIESQEPPAKARQRQADMAVLDEALRKMHDHEQWLSSRPPTALNQNAGSSGSQASNPNRLKELEAEFGVPVAAAPKPLFSVDTTRPPARTPAPPRPLLSMNSVYPWPFEDESAPVFPTEPAPPRSSETSPPMSKQEQIEQKGLEDLQASNADLDSLESKFYYAGLKEELTGPRSRPFSFLQSGQQVARAASPWGRPAPASQRGMTASLRPGGSFLQLRGGSEATQAQSAQANPFAQVTQMIKDMLGSLNQALAETQSKMQWCNSEEAKNKASQTDNLQRVKDLNMSIATTNATIQVMINDIQTATVTVAKMRQDYANAQKKFSDDMAALGNNTAFYQESAQVLKSGIDQLRKSGAPAMNGVIALMSVTYNDFTGLAAEINPEDQQKRFESMQAIAMARINDVNAQLQFKQTQKANLDSELQREQLDRDSYQRALDTAVSYSQQLQASCAIPQDTPEQRAAKRADTIKNLQDALQYLQPPAPAQG